MKKNTLINLRINKDLKENFQNVVEQEGFTMSQILEASMKDIVRRGKIPLSIKAKIERKNPSILSIPFIKSCIETVIAEMKLQTVKSISLFGSYSVGQATTSSDVDLFLEVEDGFSLFNLADLQIKLEKIMMKKVDLVTKCEDSFFTKHIQKEKIVLYERA